MDGAIFGARAMRSRFEISAIGLAISILSTLQVGCVEGPTCKGAVAPEVKAGPDTGMMLVPAGPFYQGCNVTIDSQCNADEHPGRCVTLSAFEIDETEVTQSAYSACVEAGSCAAQQMLLGACPELPMNVPHQPVVCVNWDQSGAFCRFIGKRLPTEAEWEKAARGVDARLYPWGNQAPTCTLANYSACTGTVKDVGTTSGDVSPYGVKDMAGNVVEWTNDWYGDDYYATAPDQDPPGASTGADRICRGSSYADDTAYMRTSARGNVTPDAFEGNLGFRCAKSIN